LKTFVVSQRGSGVLQNKREKDKDPKPKRNDVAPVRGIANYTENNGVENNQKEVA